VRLGALAAVAALFSLALWPPPLRGAIGRGEDAHLCRGKINRLARIAQAGHEGHDSFSERELNAHLARILARNRAAHQARGLTVGIRDLRFSLAQGPTFFVDTRLLSAPLVFTIELACSTDTGPPQLRALAVGHLPFLGPLKNLMIGRMKPLFAQLRNETVVWEHLTSCKVPKKDPGKEIITVSVDGRARKGPSAD
jgi:hypothetical protein